MKTPNLVRRFPAPALLLLLLASCKGVGIFSTLAVTEKVIDGSLPDGISADAGVLYASGITTGWAFFSAGPSMWAKDLVTADAGWEQIPLPAGYHTVQSIASTTNDILLAAVGTSGGDRVTTLFSVDGVAVDGTLTYSAPIVTWTSSDTEYYNASVFSTGGAFYINLLTFNDEFANDNAELSASELYSWNGSLSGPDGNFDANLNTSPDFRYVTDVAAGGGGTLFTVQDEDSEAGLLLNSTGGVRSVVEFTTTTDYSTRPFSSIEWLGAPVSAYFMGITTISGRNGALLVSDNGTNWYTVDNVDDDDTYVSFVDVSGVPGSTWILAGRDIGGEDGGYEQIDVETAAIGTDTWFVSSDDFADSTSYISTDMPDVTITDFTVIGSTLYASTRYAGIYSLDISAVDGEWAEE